MFVPVYAGPSFAGTFVPTVVHGIFRKLLAGKLSSGSVATVLLLLTAALLVTRSDSGLPFASVSHGVPAGRFVPRRRRYWDTFSAGMRKVITLMPLVAFAGPASRQL